MKKSLRLCNKNKMSVGVIILIVSGVVCKILGAVFRLPLTNMLGVEAIGKFQVVMAFYAFALVFVSGGIASAVSKMIGKARAQYENLNAKQLLLKATKNSCLIAFVFGVLFFVVGLFLERIYGNFVSMCCGLFVVLLPLGVCLAALRGVFQGFQEMTPTAISQIVEQVFKFAFGLWFAFLFQKASADAGVFGAFLGIVLSEIVSVVLLVIWCCVSKICQNSNSNVETKQFADYNKTNIVFMLCAIALPLVGAVDALVVVPRMTYAGFETSYATKLFGLQTGVANALLNVPLVFSVAISTAMLPNLSFLIAKKCDVAFSIKRGLRILLFLILPACFGILAISKEVLKVVYSNLSMSDIEICFNLLICGAVATIFLAIVQYFVVILQAKGENKFLMKIFFVSASVKVGTTAILAGFRGVNIFSIVVGNLVMYGILSIWCISKIKETERVAVKFGELFCMLFGTFVMFGAVYFFVQCNYFNPIVNLIVGVLIGCLVYVVFTAPYWIKLLNKERSQVGV